MALSSFTSAVNGRQNPNWDSLSRLSSLYLSIESMLPSAFPVALCARCIVSGALNPLCVRMEAIGTKVELASSDGGRPQSDAHVLMLPIEFRRVLRAQLLRRELGSALHGQGDIRQCALGAVPA